MSLLLLFNQNAHTVARELATQSDSDLERLREVVEEAVESGASPTELAERVKQDVPGAAQITPLLQQGGTPLATWLLLVLTIIMLLLQVRAEQRDKRSRPNRSSRSLIAPCRRSSRRLVTNLNQTRCH